VKGFVPLIGINREPKVQCDLLRQLLLPILRENP
jgi:hypothetical protein